MLDEQIQALNQEHWDILQRFSEVGNRFDSAKAELDHMNARVKYISERMSDLIAIREAMSKTEFKAA